MKPRKALALSFPMAATVVVGVVALALTWVPPGPRDPQIIRGVGTATDGRVALTIDGYYYISARALGFTRIDPDINWFIVVNITYANVGNQNMHVLSTFAVFVANGTTNLNNSVWGGPTVPASPPGRFTLPPGAGLVVPPGGTAKGWMAFYLPDVLPKDFPQLRFLTLQYTYWDYGDLHNLAVRFLIAPRPGLV